MRQNIKAPKIISTLKSCLAINLKDSLGGRRCSSLDKNPVGVRFGNWMTVVGG